MQQYHNHILAQINLPNTFATLLVKIQSHVDLRTSSSGRTLQDLFDLSLQHYTDAKIYLSLLQGEWKSSLLEHNGLALEMVQKMLCELAHEFLAHYDEEPEHFGVFVAYLQPPMQLNIENRKNWSMNLKPVIEDILTSIEEARAHFGANGVIPKPSVLPDLFRMKLWLLPWPEAEEDSTSALTNSILLILVEITSGDAPLYHTRFYDLQTMLSRIPSPKLSVRIALELGDRIRTRSKLCRALIEELQARFLLEITGPTIGAKVLQTVKKLAKSLIGDMSEETRRRGFAVMRAAEKATVSVRK